MTLDDLIAAKKARLDALHPLDQGTLAALDAWYDVELTYTSNAIEGNTLTRVETAIVLEKGLTVRGKPLKDHLEAIDHKDALDYMRVLAREDEPPREADIREFHRLVLGRSSPGEAGRYSSRQRTIAGSRARLPLPAEIQPLMADLAGWLRTAPAGYATAFEAHWRLVAIHPFSDGNGRTARLLTNLLLLRAGYPPIVIGPEHRPDYIDALEHRHVAGDPDPYRHLMAERLDAGLAHYLSILAPAPGVTPPRARRPAAGRGARR